MRARDMTFGRPVGLILEFALPMMAGNICQQLYTIVDAAFVGQVAGFQALAAVGAADWLNWMVLGIVFGFTQGFSILISQRFGSGGGDGLKTAIGNAVSLTALITAALMAASQLLTNPLLLLLKTPDDVMPMAVTYLRIIYAGLPVLAAYNVQAAILRAVGDSRTPFFAMLIASAANILLDYLLVAVLRMGVAGAALGTVIAQAVSVLYCLRVMLRAPVLRFSSRDLRLEADTARRLIALGTPGAVQNTVIGLGGLVIQRVLNGFGTVFIAGFTATNKLYGLMEMAATSYGGAISTYAGQNYGARKIGRIRSGVSSGARLAFYTSVVIAAALFLVGRPVLSLFVSSSEAQVNDVLDIAQKYLNRMLIALPMLYFLYVFRSALSGMGDTVTPLISGMIELFMRVTTVLLLPKLIGRDGVYFAEAAAWTGAAILLTAVYLARIRREVRQAAPEELIDRSVRSR